MSRPLILKARHVVPVSRPPIDNGVVEIHEAQIVEVRRAARHESGASVVDCGDAVLLPGLVNAHTHLELTHLEGKVPPSGAAQESAGDSIFVDWLHRLLRTLQESGNEPEVITASANEGAAMCLRAGVTTVGDVTRRPGVTRLALRDGRLRVVSFGEVIAVGALRNRLKERLESAVDATSISDRLTAAVSPHAPYTCDRRALRACKEAARKLKIRLCIHLAETREEETFTLEGKGPLAELLLTVGVWDDSVKHPGRRPVQYADELGMLSPRTLLAHVNYVNDEDMGRIARSGAHVAYCPRTHAAFGHEPHRFREMRAAGINVCVGTDSLASNPSLSILDELRYLRGRFEDVRPGVLIEMGTLCAARALGLGNEIGALEPGKQADVLVMPLDPAGDRDPIEHVLRSESVPRQIYVAGQRADRS